MHKPMISTRSSRLDDAGELTDIDTKSMEIPWTAEEWYEIVRTNGGPRMIVLATYYGNAIGFACVKIEGTEALIERLAVKQQFRRKGASRLLLEDVSQQAQDRQLTTLSIILPESFVYPDEHGERNITLQWAMACGFTPTKPFIKNHFTAYGTTEDGVKFTTPLT